MYSAARRVAGIVLLREDGAVLLQHRDDKPGLPHAGLWVFPGGHCEPDEPLERCARREFLEETDYRCGEISELETFPSLSVEGFPSVELTIYYAVYDGLQPVKCREGQALAFIGRSDAARYPMPGYLLGVWDLALERYRRE